MKARDNYGTAPTAPLPRYGLGKPTAPLLRYFARALRRVQPFRAQVAVKPADHALQVILLIRLGPRFFGMPLTTIESGFDIFTETPERDE
jgi:hypothetical protein